MTEERKLVSLLFADIVDSTAMGASHDPELARWRADRSVPESSKVS